MTRGRWRLPLTRHSHSHLSAPPSPLLQPTWDNGDLNFCSFSWAKNFTCCKKSTPTPPPSTTPTSPSSPCLSGYTTAFKDYTTTPTTGYYAGKAGTGAATIDNENYLTYGLVDSVQDCIAICNSINNCNFINVYQELESDVKDSYSPGKLTCAAFKACSGTEKATNYGGQSEFQVERESRPSLKSLLTSLHFFFYFPR